MRLDESQLSGVDKFWLAMGETVIPYVLGILTGMLIMWMALA
jgi:hypothetical protein